MPTSTVMWFRRDLRLRDHPALLEAGAEDAVVLALFVLDPALWGPSGLPRRRYLTDSLRSLDASLRELGGGLTVRRGDPVVEVVEAARAVGATRVHVSADYAPYGHRRDAEVEKALAEHGIELVRTGSPYAVAPDRVKNGSGEPYRVFTPFSRAWIEHGWREPVPAPDHGRWVAPEGPLYLPEVELPDGVRLPEAGERAADERWTSYAETRLDAYDTQRNRPDRDATSHMSVHLKWGEIHPRTMLADIATHTSKGAATYRKELGWREFYADVLFQQPHTAREYLRPELGELEYDEPGARLDAWAEGRTGYPIVDAGMRQMHAIGWMHNRVRMIVASFLVKDLHIEWQHGGRVFMHHLVDADLPSNQHGWQWVAGSGTDPAPYFRVFNPVVQGRKFDPDGTYIRRYVPELADIEDAYVHEPWTMPGGPPNGYPAPIVDHAAERKVALARFERVRR